MMNSNQIHEIIASDPDYSAKWGLRVMSQNPTTGEYPTVSIGDVLDNSYIWDYDKSTGDQLGGVCAIEIETDGDLAANIGNAIANIRQYLSLGNQVVLIKGDNGTTGEDPNEIVITGYNEVMEAWNV